MSTVTQTVLIDGPRQAYVHVVIQGDTNGPVELNNQKILDTTNDIRPLGIPTQSTISRIWWNFNSFEAYLSKFDMSPPIIWALNYGSGNKMDFRSFGGIKVPVSMDGNGDILLSTNGLAVGAVGTLVVELKKD